MDPYSGKARQVIHKLPTVSGLIHYSLPVRLTQVYFLTHSGLTLEQKLICGLTVYGLTVVIMQACFLILDHKPVSGLTVSGLIQVWIQVCFSTASGLTLD